MSNKLLKENKHDQDDAVKAVQQYNAFGWIFILCGIGSLILMLFVSQVPHDYEKYNVPLYFGIWTVISFILIVIGVLPLVLGKCSKKYRDWVKKDVDSFINHMAMQTAIKEKRRIKADIRRDKKRGLDVELECDRRKLEEIDEYIESSRNSKKMS